MTDPALAERMDQALAKAMTLNERFAAAYGLLAEVRSRRGRRDEALGLAQRGVALEPSRTQNRLALARVLWSLSRRDEALREGRDALDLATSDSERVAAQQLIEFFQRNSGPK